MNPLPNGRRRPEYLSPSALMTYEKDKPEYYRKYCSPTKPPRFPQTQPMSVGSAFDAEIKSCLHDRIYGKNHPDAPKYQIDAIFEAQVESHNRDWARVAGKHVFEAYKESGALSDLMLELQGAVDDPRFEFEVKGIVEGSREGVTGKKMGVPLLGKPDLRFVNREGAEVVTDWKVNGYCGKSSTSPMPGYIMLRDDCATGNDASCWMRKGAHKDAFVQPYKGLMINTGTYMERHDTDWATQLSVYGWLLGAKVGVEDIKAVDQITAYGNKRDSSGKPRLRIASHRLRVSSKFQFEVMERFSGLWGILTDEPFYFFRDLSFEASEAKCQMLDEACRIMSDPGLSTAEKWVMGMGRTN